MTIHFRKSGIFGRLAAALALAACLFTAGGSMAESRDVVFQGGDGVPLSGTLTLPDGGEKHPALVLIQGSGPTDRNGNQTGLRTDLLKQLADALAAEGIATLRYDKRGMYANAATMPSDPEALPHFFRWQAFLDDAAGAYRFLTGHAGTDPERVGIVGHSEGGIIALDVAARGLAQPKVLVLLSTPGRPLGTVIQEQLARILKAQGAPAEVAEELLAADRRIAAHIAETGTVPADVPQGLKALYPPYLGPFLQPMLALDPARMAGSLDIPIMVLTGKADTQVSAERDAAAMARALAGGSTGSLVAAPDGVSHNLKSVEGNGPGFEGPINPDVLDRLNAWLAERL